MTIDRSFVELNRAASTRMRALPESLSDEDLMRSAGRWTIAVAYAHLAFWDLRVMQVLDATEQSGDFCAPELDIAINDVLTPILAAIPPRQAVRLALEAAAALDRRLEMLPSELLSRVYIRSERWVLRALHRNHHLDTVEVDAVEAALGAA